MMPDLRYPYYDGPRQKPSSQKRIFEPYDWASLQKLHAKVSELKNGAEITDSSEIRRYLRMQAFALHHSHAKSLDKSNGAMIQLAKDFKISPYKAARLFVELQNLSSSHLHELNLDAVLNAGDAKIDLMEIFKALDSLSKFSEGLLDRNAAMRKQIAKHWLQHEAWKWVNAKLEKKHPSRSLADETWNKVERLGFDYQRVTDDDGQTHELYGERQVVERWLETSILMNQWARSSVKIQANKSTLDGPFWKSKLTPIVKTFGQVLPRIYTRYTGRAYYPSKGGGSKVLDKAGVNFIRQAMKVMGIKPLATSTLSDHYKKAKALQKNTGGVT